MLPGQLSNILQKRAFFDVIDISLERLVVKDITCISEVSASVKTRQCACASVCQGVELASRLRSAIVDRIKNLCEEFSENSQNTMFFPPKNSTHNPKSRVTVQTEIQILKFVSSSGSIVQ